MNIEGIRITETPEQHIEKKSVTITENAFTESENLDFSNCAKTPEDKIRELESLKKELLDFNDCIKVEQVQSDEIEDNFEDCRRR